MGIESVLWLAAVVVFAIVEGATTALISVWFVVGAVVAFILSLFGLSMKIQFMTFAVVSAVALAITIPLLADRRRQNKAPVTNGSPLTIGKRGVVLKTVVPGEVGRVRVDGLDWQARSEETLPQGTRCEVSDVDGAVLLVKAVHDSDNATV